MARKTDNLKVPSSKEARKYGAMGGKASVAARQRRKQLRELLEEALAMPAKDRDGTKAEAIAAALVERAEKGDTRAFELVRDTLGEKPTAQVDVTSSDGSMSPVAAIDLGARPLDELMELTRLAWHRQGEIPT